MCVVRKLGGNLGNQAKALQTQWMLGKIRGTYLDLVAPLWGVESKAQVMTPETRPVWVGSGLRRAVWDAVGQSRVGPTGGPCKCVRWASTTREARGVRVTWHSSYFWSR